MQPIFLSAIWKYFETPLDFEIYRLVDDFTVLVKNINRGVAQLVGRGIWGAEAACSNHATPTNK